jgi:hypothetical protein
MKASFSLRRAVACFTVTVGVICLSDKSAAQTITGSGMQMSVWAAEVWMGLSDVSLNHGEFVSAKIQSINCPGHPAGFSNMGQPGRPIPVKSDRIENGIVQTKDFGSIKVYQTDKGLPGADVDQHFRDALRAFCK